MSLTFYCLINSIIYKPDSQTSDEGSEGTPNDLGRLRIRLIMYAIFLLIGCGVYYNASFA